MMPIDVVADEMLRISHDARGPTVPQSHQGGGESRINVGKAGQLGHFVQRQVDSQNDRKHRNLEEPKVRVLQLPVNAIPIRSWRHRKYLHTTRQLTAMPSVS